MTVLAELSRGLISIQCDLCFPPVLTINTPEDLQRTRWNLRTCGSRWDVCPNCTAHVHPRHREPRRDLEPVEPDPQRLPNVVIIGASKAGTTSMHSYLGLHPDIALSRDKELRFFQDPDHRSWIGRYQGSFTTGTRYRVESTPFYSQSPCYPGVADRMADLIPDARLIYLVRDPIDRLVAEYVEQTQWGVTRRSFDLELEDAADPQHRLVAPSRYATQLRDYLRRFDQNRIKVIDLADLATDPAAVVSDVFTFLGLDDPGLASSDFQRLNTRADKRSFPWWMMALRGGPLVRTMHRLPERPRRAVSQLAHRHLRTAVKSPHLSPQKAAELRAILQPEIDDLRALTGKRFATWSL